ncbi:MAG: glycogen debranching N-terminal domain-containing protein [Acidimicrobiales bacterium]
MPSSSQLQQIAGFASDSPDSGGRVLVEGSTFVVSGPGGDITPGGTEGLFVDNTRVISRWKLTVDGETLEAMGGFDEEPFQGVFVSRAPVRSGKVEPTLLVERRRYVGSGMREDICVRNYAPEPAGISLTLEVASDMADLFEVKLGQRPAPRDITVATTARSWTARGRHGQADRHVKVTADDAAVANQGLSWRAVVDGHSTWRTSVEVTTGVDGTDAAARFPLGSKAETSVPARRIAQWRSAGPTLSSPSAGLVAAFERSQTDLSALRVRDRDNPDLEAIAAGAPWFMAVFGRDSLLASCMALPANPDLAVGTLRTLASHQGRRVEPISEEEPGRIVHELRPGADTDLALGATGRYYGSVDATPLFVMLLGEVERWGVPKAVVDDLLPAADMALEWIRSYGDRDGDGLVEYARRTDRGLLHQGWKDSADGINFADGRRAEPPIALVEVQAYVYGAYKARAEIAARRFDTTTAGRYERLAEAIKARINEDFWLPDARMYAVGLDRDKRPIDSKASNMGHVLWAGAADADKAEAVGAHLESPDFFSGYGLRTLAASMGAYNPCSYHNGSVWPHDTALAVTGLARYGQAERAQKIACGLMRAAAFFHGRLPELFCGFDASSYPSPVPYPNACSTQAWASAAPIALITALLGVEPDVPAGVVAVNPAIPAEWEHVELSHMPLADRHLSITAYADGTWEHSPISNLRVERSASPHGQHTLSP